MNTTPNTTAATTTTTPTSTPTTAERPEMDDRPPLLGSWRNIYIVVAVALAAYVAVFFAITRAFS